MIVQEGMGESEGVRKDEGGERVRVLRDEEKMKVGKGRVSGGQ